MLRDRPPYATHRSGRTTQHIPRTLGSGGKPRTYLPGLDGLRALAVTAVLLYHAGLPWIPGGFLGVEVFFVISGFLITTLLLTEWHRHGRIDLKAFWLRRARRLLPALYLVLAATLAFALILLPEEVARMRGEVLAALGYVTNWYLAFNEQSYFEAAGRPSLLQHLWSLAVEEQFYLLWPLVISAGFWGAGVVRSHGRRRLVLLATLAGAVGSVVLMASLYQPGMDPSRLYYGTDTRAAGLLIGAALALVWTPEFETPRHTSGLQRRLGWIAPLILDLAVLAALGSLVWLCLQVNESQPFLFRGGFAVVALATAAAILVAIHPQARLSTVLLESRVLRWIGVRSYGIYLWHWPVFMVTRPDLDVPVDGLPLLTLRLSITLALAALSYRYLETPIRNGALARAWNALREARGTRRWRLGAGWVGAVGACTALCIVLGVAVSQAEPPPNPSYLSVESVNTATSLPDDETSAASTTPSQSSAATDEPAPAPPSRVTAIGDSVMVGAAGELQRAIGNDLEINAEVGRQAPAVVEILRQRRDADQLGDTVVVHIGNNGTFDTEQFEEMMQILSDVRKIVFVNTKVPRYWEQPNNEMLAEEVPSYPNVVLVDWHAASTGHPELFAEDGHHLQIEGQQLYAELIAANLTPA